MAPRKMRFDIRQAGRQILAVSLALLVVNVLFYALLVRPRTLSLRELTADNEPQLQVLKHRETEVQGHEEYLAALQKASAELTRLRQEVLSTKDRRMIEVQLELARLAGQFGINLRRVQNDNQKLEDEALERFAMIVPLEGGYANLRKFVEAVEQSDRFLVIESVALGAGREGGVMLELNITLATYFDAPELRPAGGRPARRA